jgi:cytochrome c2
MRHVIALLLLPVAAAGCSGQREHRFAEARSLIEARCGSCHIVPGVPAARGDVGPPLAGIGQRQVLAGYFPNSRPNMLRWITHAQSMLPGNAMPDSGLTPYQASKVADYLYTLDK